LIYDSHGSRLCQGGVFREIVVLEKVEVAPPNNPQEGDGEIEVFETLLPYVLMVSQDCDLEWDDRLRKPNAAKNHDKFLSAMLVCPAYAAGQVKLGTHLADQGLVMATYSGSRWDLIQQNNNDRYHYLPAAPEMGIPELVIDFKRYQTVPRDTLLLALGDKRALGALKPLYRERLSQRFANYLSRIGLPEVEVEAVAG
jgi:hypothetical protein